jgi:hypothetical protein
MRTGRPRRIRVFCLNALSKYLVERSDGTDISAIFDRCFSLSAEILRGELNRRHRGRHTAARARIPEQRKNYESPHRHLHAIKKREQLNRANKDLFGSWLALSTLYLSRGSD